MSEGRLGPLVSVLQEFSGSQGIMGLSDDELLQRFVARREDDAFRMIVRRYAPLVWSVCSRVLGRSDEVEDACQACFLVFIRKAGSIRKGSSLSCWFHGVAYRTAVRARQQGRKRAGPDLPRLLKPEEDAPGPLTEAIQRETSAILDEEVHRLPQKYRIAVLLCYFQGLSHEEAAHVLGCPRSTVAIRLVRARERLRTRLTRRGLALGTAGVVWFLSSCKAPAHAPSAVGQALAELSLLSASNALGTLSVSTVQLAEGVLTAMWWSKMKLTAWAVLLCLLGTGLTLLGYGATSSDIQVLPVEPGAPAPVIVAQAPGAEPEKDPNQPQDPAKPQPDDLLRQALERKRLEAQHREMKAAQLEQATDRLKRAREEYLITEEKITRERIEFKVRMIEAETRLQYLEREQALDMEAEHEAIMTLQEAIQNLEKTLPADELQKKPEYAKLKEQLAGLKGNKRRRMDELLQARIEVLTAEEQLGSMERRHDFQRARAERELEFVENRVHQFRDEVHPDPHPREPASPQHQIDQLRRELRELREQVERLQRGKGER